MKRTEERIRLHGLSVKELNDELNEAERTLLNFRFDAGLNRLTNPAGLHNARKRVATLKTLIREKELVEQAGVSSIEEYKAYKVAERRTFRLSRKAR